VTVRPTSLKDETFGRRQLYWKKALSNFPVQQLPNDHPRPLVSTFSKATQRLELPSHLGDALKTLSDCEGSNLFITLLTAFKVLLARYTGQQEIVVVSPVANRRRTETAQFAETLRHTLALRTLLDGDPTFRVAMQRVRASLDTSEDQELPFEALVGAVASEHNRDQRSIFPAMFVLLDTRFEMSGTHDLAAVLLELEQDLAKVDVRLSLVISIDGLRGYLDYNADLFDAATICRMAGHFRTLLLGIVTNPAARISELPLLDDAERHKLLFEWNDTARDYPTETCLHELIEAQVKRTPDAVALVFENEALTYRELNGRANQLAHYLRKLGVGPDAVVGVLAERSIEMVVGLLATIKAGGAYLPIDENYPVDRLAFMLGDAKPRAILAQRHLVEKLPRHLPEVVFLDEDLVGESDADTASGARPDDLAYIIYTSGSTGQPKGAMNTHRGICSRLIWMQEACGLTADDRVLQKTLFSFDVSVWEFFWPLLTGARLIVARPGLHGDSRYLIDTICEHGITTMHFVPPMLAAFLQDEDARRCTSLRRVICSGEVLTFESQERFFATLPKAELYNLYGPTEAAVDVTFWKCRRDIRDRSVPIGRPVANTQIYILDRTMQPVPTGVAGEIHIGGVQLARGYLARPKLTAEKFVPNPFGEGRLYKTGDLARYRTDGVIEYIGRIDHQVKLRGYRVELGEIEAVMEKHPAVRQCIALVLRNRTEFDKRLVAYVIASCVSVDELRRHAQNSLPDYMVPSAFVFLDKLPLTGNGKIDRQAFPEPVATGGERVFVGPRDRLESQLAAIWESALGVQPIGVTDDFFEIGGHSLLAVQVVNELNALTGKRLSFSVILQARTIAQLADLLRKNELVSGASNRIGGLNGRINADNPIRSFPCRPQVGAADEVSTFPTSFAQQRLWFLDQREPHSAAYNVPAAVRILGDIDVEALERSFSEVVRRHEVLRTTFRLVEGYPMQCIAPARDVTLPITDLCGLEPAERREQEHRLIVEEAWRPFNLACGPLIRASLLRTADAEHVLLTNKHHIICDDWSDEVFTCELIAAYEAFAEGRKPNLPELPIQYADFAQRQRAFLLDGALKDQLGYWREKLADLPLLQLWTDRRRPPSQTFSGASEPVELPTELTNALGVLSTSEGATLFMTLLTAFKALLARYTRQEDIVVGSPMTNRTNSEAENLIGFFVNTLVLRTTLDGDPTFREALRRVRKTALDAFQHQEVPFDALVEALAPERHLNRNPLFQVMFVMLKAGPKKRAMRDSVLVPIEIEQRTAKFDLTMSLFNGPDGLRGSLNYDVDLFDAATIRRMAGHFRMLLLGIVADPEARISELPMLTAGELEQIKIEWNRSETDFPRNASIEELFENQAGQRSEAIAVEDEATRWTYRELNQRSNQIAHSLREAGAKAESLVGICMERSAQIIAGMLGILKAGCAYVPIDPAYPAERRSLMLEGVPLLLTTKKLAGEFGQGAARVICVDNESVLQASAENLPRLSNGESLAYVIYTSGSTGQPKGVAVMHCGVIRLFYNTNFLTIERSDVVAQTLNICFDAAMQEIWGALLNGARLVIVDKVTMLSPPRFKRELERRGITVLMPTRTLFNLMAREAPGAFANLKYVAFGGEAADPRSVAAVLKHGPPKHLLNAYGPTEASITATCMEVLEVPEGARSIPIGRPISNTTIYLLDSHRNVVPIGVAGEIYIGGAGVARAYVGAPQLTAERFVDDPFSNEPGARLYKTGDLARWLPDGTIDLIGRADTQVKIRGFRIEPSEIEAVLKQHPGARDALVVVHDDASSEEKRLVAYVEGERSQLNATELRDFLKTKLPDYMLPAAIVVLEKFPLNSNGKIDRQAFPEAFTTQGEKVLVRPRDDLEARLTGVWENALGIQPIGVTDDFFEIGGHSLLAVRMLSEMERILGKNLPLATLLQMPTIEKLAAALRQEDWKPTWSPLVAIRPRGSRPPFFGVHGRSGTVLFYRELEQWLGEEQPLYGLQAQGLDGGPIVHKSIEAIAKYYITEMRKIQPHGPYFFGGYSLGGVVAFEMAQQLRTAGEQVALVVLFDTQNPVRPARRYSFAKRMKLRLRALEHSSPGAKLRYFTRRLWAKVGYYLTEWRKNAERLVYKVKRLNGAPVSCEQHRVHVEMMHARAVAAYRPHAYPGRVTLFRRQNPDDGREHAPDYGWAEFVQGGIDIDYVPGGHLTIFAGANVRALAEKLEARIHAALAENIGVDDVVHEKSQPRRPHDLGSW
jgi:amino acid adenylation domain-containing protein